jgi:hypothetical protein
MRPPRCRHAPSAPAHRLLPLPLAGGRERAGGSGGAQQGPARPAAGHPVRGRHQGATPRSCRRGAWLRLHMPVAQRSSERQGLTHRALSPSRPASPSRTSSDVAEQGSPDVRPFRRGAGAQSVGLTYCELRTAPTLANPSGRVTARKAGPASRARRSSQRAARPGPPSFPPALHLTASCPYCPAPPAPSGAARRDLRWRACARGGGPAVHCQVQSWADGARWPRGPRLTRLPSGLVSGIFGKSCKICRLL